MIANWGGECAACGNRFQRGDSVKFRWVRRFNGDKYVWEREPGRYAHTKCPKVKVPDGVDPETGEILMVTPRDDQLTVFDYTDGTVDVETRLV